MNSLPKRQILRWETVRSDRNGPPEHTPGPERREKYVFLNLIIHHHLLRRKFSGRNAAEFGSSRRRNTRATRFPLPFPTCSPHTASQSTKPREMHTPFPRTAPSTLEVHSGNPMFHSSFRVDATLERPVFSLQIDASCPKYARTGRIHRLATNYRL